MSLIDVDAMEPDPKIPSTLVRSVFRRHGAYLLDRTPVRHKLDQNEVPFDLPLAFKRRVAERLVGEDWSRYPDFHAAGLRKSLGEFLDWPADGVLIGNGSGELLLLALNACVEPGTEVLTLAPSFSLYGLLIDRVGGVAKTLASGPDLRLPIDALEKEIRKDPRRPVMLCSPNNPTGESISPDDVERLLRPLEAPLLLDNAYGEFCDDDYMPLLSRHRHLMIFRTFSKALSLAGLRLGYLIADPELALELYKVKLPYKINWASWIAGEELLRDRHLVERRLRVIRARRLQWEAMLMRFGFEVTPSAANFILVRHPRWMAIRDGFEERGIRVRKLGGHPALADSLRITVAGGDALRAVRRALEEILGDEMQGEGGPR